ncbi:MAG: PAS domain S-box protein, partial [Helicobacteraceae bacterium]|nr:PAS domain S-box protein [Candidatus Sulfurimonas ponti]
MVKKNKSNTSLRAKAEKTLQTRGKTGTDSEITYSLNEMQEIFHDLEVHQIELEMQNKELIRTCQELDSSKRRYSDFYNLAPVGYLTLNEEDLILEANLTALTLFGVKTQALIEKKLTDFILKKDQDIYYLFKKSYEKEQHFCELRMHHYDGASFWVQLEGSIQNDDGVRAYRLIMSPIAERKKAQEQQRIAAIAFESQNGMVITNPNGVIEKVNRAFTTISGYSKEESIGQTMSLLKSERHSPLFYQRMWESIKKTQRWQ